MATSVVARTAQVCPRCWSQPVPPAGLAVCTPCSWPGVPGSLLPTGERALAQSPLHRREPRNPMSLGNRGAAGSSGEPFSPPPVAPSFLTLIPSATPQRCELPGLVGAGTPASFLVLCISLVEESGPTLPTSVCDGLRSPASVTSPWLCSGTLKAALLRAVLSPQFFRRCFQVAAPCPPSWARDDPSDLAMQNQSASHCSQQAGLWTPPRAKKKKVFFHRFSGQNSFSGGLC